VSYSAVLRAMAVAVVLSATLSACWVTPKEVDDKIEAFDTGGTADTGRTADTGTP